MMIRTALLLFSLIHLFTEAFGTICYSSHCNNRGDKSCFQCKDKSAKNKWFEYIDEMVKLHRRLNKENSRDFINHFQRTRDSPKCCETQQNAHCSFHVPTSGEVNFGCSSQPLMDIDHCKNLNHSVCCQSDLCNIPANFEQLILELFPVTTERHIHVSHSMIIGAAIALFLFLVAILAFYFGACCRQKLYSICHKSRKKWLKHGGHPNFECGNSAPASSAPLMVVNRNHESALTHSTYLDGNISYSTDWNKQLLNDEFTGSGAGRPLFVNRTISRQIQLQQYIGEGHFGTVYMGHWRGEQVAVKVFQSYNEHSWLREVHIYSMRVVSHPCILRYIAHDINDAGTLTELWLVTEYHPRGSLFNYLSEHTITVLEMLRMAHSLAAGLDHLHMEFRGAEGKPSIAHRDIKSRNVLVKMNGECCLADFGLSIVQYEYGHTDYFGPSSAFSGCGDHSSAFVTTTATTSLDGSGAPWRGGFSSSHPLPMKDMERGVNVKPVPPPIATIQVGTRRYMPPELLKYASGADAQGGCLIPNGCNNSVFLPDSSKPPQPMVEFDLFKQADIYSLALVYWEILRRCHAPPTIEASPCILPFQELVEHDPSAEEMRVIVCVENRRPSINPVWLGENSYTTQMTQLIQECWHQEPFARHSAMRLKKTLGAMMNEYQSENNPGVHV